MGSELARKYHSVTFGAKNTWDDWGLIPTQRPSIASPELVESDSEADSIDGELDNTEVFDQPYYGLAKGTMNFLVYNPGTTEYSYHTWIKNRSDILNYLHNRRRRLVLDDEPGYYYEGRFQVSFTPGKDYSSVSIEYAIDTYKQSF